MPLHSRIKLEIENLVFEEREYLAITLLEVDKGKLINVRICKAHISIWLCPYGELILKILSEKLWQNI